MHGLDTAKRHLAERILEYLMRHPHATDTVEGIARFWLADAEDGASSDDTLEAVTHLVRQGRMRRSLKPDGEWIYGLAADAANDEGAR